MKFATANMISADKRCLVSFIRNALEEERSLYGEMLVWAFIKHVGIHHCNGCSVNQIRDMFWTYLCAYEGESDF